MQNTIIYDNIHGYIEIDNIAKQIIDTPEFQRLKRIKQCGVAHYVFPTCVHTRFEHSIGVYHLAKQMITKLKDNQSELNITNEIVLLVSLAGLCHDLGHVMFSHLYDEYVKKLYPTIVDEHEYRSIKILNHMVKKYNINLDNYQIEIISDLILSNINNYNNWLDKYKIGKFLFEIIANKKNNIDVDKFDYINRDVNSIGLKYDANFTRLLLQARVINDEICYPKQTQDDIFNMFFIRYQLHKTVYTHKTVKAIEKLIVDIIDELNNSELFDIVECMFDVEKLIKLTDDYIYRFDNNRVNDIINNIETRNIPKLVYENITDEFFELDNEEIENYDYTFVYTTKIGYVNSNENPLNNITYYDTKNYEIVDINKNYSLLLNKNHQEFIYRLYK